MSISRYHRGRGSTLNPNGRFEKLDIDMDGDALDTAITSGDADFIPSISTQYFVDHTKSVIATNSSPDVGFDASINPYRGCEHGCVYCYARPNHEFLGLSAGLDFESKIFVKKDAPALLAKVLNKKTWQPKLVVIGGVTDAYQAIERKLLLTRQCFEVFLKFGNPTGVVTKSSLIKRDVDVLQDLTKISAVVVYLSLTSLNIDLQSKLEPRAVSPKKRLQTVEYLAKHKIPVGIIIGPVIPSLTDHEIPNILKQAKEYGASFASYIMLRLPYGVKDLFEEWLKKHAPLKHQKVMSRIAEVRGGKTYDADFSQRMSGTGEYANQVKKVFTIFRNRYGLDNKPPELSIEHFRRHCRVDQQQLGLFG